MTAVTFTTFDLALASLLVIAAAGASLCLSLGIHRQILWASTRLVAQLLLVGLVLRSLFASESVWLALGLLMLMVLVAIRETAARPGGEMSRSFGLLAGLAGIAGSVVLVGGIAAMVLRHEQDIGRPQVLIPIAGIILGTAMTAASLALSAFVETVRRDRAAIEAKLALGKGRFEALASVTRGAARNGIIPTLNQMMGAGVITLPGLMSGQVLAGQDPLEAAYTQIFLSLLLCITALIAVCGVIMVALLRVTDDRDRLRLDRM